MKIAAAAAFAALSLAACASAPVAKKSLAANTGPLVSDPSTFGGRSASYGDLGLWRSAFVNGDAYAYRKNSNDFPAGVLVYQAPSYGTTSPK